MSPKVKQERFTGAAITVTTPDGHEMTHTMTLTETGFQSIG